jgi:hypothetical protein
MDQLELCRFSEERDAQALDSLVEVHASQPGGVLADLDETLPEYSGPVLVLALVVYAFKQARFSVKRGELMLELAAGELEAFQLCPDGPVLALG